MSDAIAVSIKTAAAKTDLSEDTIRAAINHGVLRAKRSGRAIRIRVDDLKAWFDQLEDVAS